MQADIFRFGVVRRLWLIILLVLFPMMALTLYASVGHFQHDSEHARTDATVMSDSFAKALGARLHGAEHLLSALSRAGMLPGPAEASCSPMLGEVVRVLPEYLALSLAAPDGRLYCSSLPLMRPASASGRPYFEHVINHGTFAVGEYQIGRVTGKASLNFAHPIRYAGSDELAAVLIASMSLENLQNLVLEAQLPPGARLTVLDREGTILARSEGNERWAGRALPEQPLTRAILSEGRGTMDASGPDGVRRLQAFAPVMVNGQPALYVLVGIEHDALMDSAWRELAQQLLSLLALVVAALVAAGIAGERTLIRPLRRLLAASESLRTGDLSARSGLPYEGSEIGELARSFDETAAAIECFRNDANDARKEAAKANEALEERVRQRTAELEAANRELLLVNTYSEVHTEALQLMNSLLDRKRLLKEILALLAARLPLPAGAVYRYDEWAGHYGCEVSHGVPAALERCFRPGEGIVGAAAESCRVIALDSTPDSLGLKLDTGLLEVSPASVIVAPVSYQHVCHEVLVLAATRRLTASEHAFIERLCAQLGVGLHNLKQYGHVKLMAEQLRARGEEVAAKNIELEEANRHKSEFLATMSHELRTPLNAVIGFSEVLKDGLVGELQPRQKEYCNEIFSSGRHLLSLINDVLDLSKIESGRMELEAECVMLAPVLQNALTIVKEEAHVAQISLELDADGCPAQIVADGRKVKQIVFNLLSNAIKFTPSGGKVRMSCRAVARQDAEQAGQGVPRRVVGALDETCEQFVELAVSDTGVGIDEADLGKLFSPFVQLDARLERRYAGTGLGLMMVRRLTELHGGMAAVESVAGAGSRFLVWLPLRQELPAGEAVSEARPSLLKGPLNSGAPRGSEVLVVEDDQAAFELIRSQLAAGELSAVQATSAETAWQALRENDIRLILLDILLPGIDGWAFLSQLKESPDHASIPVIIVSVVADTQRGISLGAAEVLQKPVGRTELLAALSRAGLFSNGTGGRRILVADDDPYAVEILAMHLAEAGFETLRAYGGSEAIAVARKERPNIIVLDLLMPEVGGFEVVEALRSHPDTADIPIVVLSAKEMSDSSRSALGAQVQQVMAKSEFSHGRFVSEVRRAMRVSSEA